MSLGTWTVYCPSCSPPPLEAAEGYSSGHQCRHRCDNDNDNDPYLCRDSHLIQSVLFKSITSQEHMVPIVARAHFSWALGGRSLGSLFQITGPYIFTALWALQRSVTFFLSLGPHTPFVAHGPRKNFASDKCKPEGLGVPAISRLKSLHFQLVFVRAGCPLSSKAATWQRIFRDKEARCS